MQHNHANRDSWGRALLNRKTGHLYPSPSPGGTTLLKLLTLLFCHNRGSGQRALFHGDRFGEIARLIDVSALGDRDVVGEELK